MYKLDLEHIVPICLFTTVEAGLTEWGWSLPSLLSVTACVGRGGQSGVSGPVDSAVVRCGHELSHVMT